MNSISFHNTHFTIIPHNGQPWLTAPQIAQALGYAREDAVSRIYRRNADEFTSSMTTTVKLTVVRKTGAVQMDVRIFSLRGAHLIAIFSRTALAKEFRRWVLDVLDKEVGIGQHVTLSDDELHSLAWLWRAADNMMDAAKSICPLLRVPNTKRPLATTPSSTNTPTPCSKPKTSWPTKRCWFNPAASASEIGIG